METAGLKSFARDARRRLKEQVAAKLALVMVENSAARRESQRAVAALEAEVARTGEAQVIERVAYLWFNRFCALRFMDANGFTSPRVVSAAEDDTRPELLAEALAGHVPDTVSAEISTRVHDLIDGRVPSRDPQGEAYRLLLVAVCNGWSGAMPFLFEGVDDASELLMPEDLLSADGVLARMRAALSDEVARDVEAIGWLYQFYIAEKKDEVFAGLKKNVKVSPENIPAATQLFTPHWIVRYLVENSLGRLWLLNRPESGLAAHMPYYIAPVELETDYLRIASPEELRICDPACGSGHMLTYAFDLLHRIYGEAGYDPGEIPALILRHNLYGIEIDERAGALAAFALVMKAAQALPPGRRRRFLREPVQPNVTVLEEVRFRPDELERYIAAAGGAASRDLFTPALRETLTQFAAAKNFGSLIRPVLADPAEARRRLEARGVGDDLMLAHVHRDVLRVLAQAEMLSPRYHVVVANPPYMGKGGMNRQLSKWVEDHYPVAKGDLMTCFMERSRDLCAPDAYWAMINIPTWMFLGGYEGVRKEIVRNERIVSFVYNGRGLFGADFGTVAFVIRRSTPGSGVAVYRKLFDRFVSVRQPEAIRRLFLDNEFNRFERDQSVFSRVPGTPIAFWLTNPVYEAFRDPARFIGEKSEIREGINTGDNDRFLRRWFEVSYGQTFLVDSEVPDLQKRWFKHRKGGEFRRWFGNNEYVLLWQDRGSEIHEFHGLPLDYAGAPMRGKRFFFKSALSWSRISSGSYAIRAYAAGQTYDSTAPSIFDAEDATWLILAFLNSAIAAKLLEALSPTLDYRLTNVGRLPLLVGPREELGEQITGNSQKLVSLARADWDAYETSWDFARSPLLDPAHRRETLAETYAAWRAQAQNATDAMRALEEENNRVFIHAYGLPEELSPHVPLHEITLTANPDFRFRDREGNREAMMQADTARELVSYAIGCLMGRYSLDRDGLVLADAGGSVAEYLALVPEPTLTPDADGILPLTEGEWFADDAAAGVRRFLRLAFGAARFEDNLRWLEEGLGKDLRRWLAKDFFADHVKRYRKRPIYWLFASPKGTFQALAYLHRMAGDTVGLVLNDYLRSMRAKLDAAMQTADAASRDAPSPGERTRALKQVGTYRKQIAELDAWERDVMHPLAGRRITLDLDDGVKRNYPKLGAALKPIPGLAAEED